MPEPADKYKGDLLLEDKTRVEKPAKYKVHLHNDDYTPMDFVISILQDYFAKEIEEATKIMLLVHNTGIGMCGVYPKEIAETKVHQVVEVALKHQHPLRCTMERV